MSERRLADYCASVDYGYTASARTAPGGPRFLRITDIVDGPPHWDSVPHCDADERTSARFRLHHGDVVIARTGATTGASALISDPPDAVFASYLVRLKVNTTIADPRFISYYLKGPQFRSYIRSVLGDKSAQPNASAVTLTNAPINAPSVGEQRAIAAVLGSLDDKIEQNRQTVQALEDLVRATFRAWFVDFEPVNAKATGATSFPGMPPAAFATLSTRLTNSPLGPVPQGWDTPPFDELVSESKERVGDQDVPAYSSTNEGVFPRGERFKKDLSKSQSKNLLVRRGDVVFGLSREILNFGVMHDEIGCVSPVYKVFRPKGSILPPHFIEATIRQRVAYFRQIVKSSSREGQSVAADHFLRLAMLIPPEPVRKAFQSFEGSLRQTIDCLNRESLKLAALRDYLLPRLLSGGVRVRPSQAEVKISCAS